MALRVCLWLTLLAFTAIVPGCLAGILANGRRWPPQRCREIARRGGWGILICCGLAAWAMGVHYPFGWVAEPLGTTAAILSQFVWMAVAEFVPRIIAARIAFPGT
jgi:hypothetical protein